MSTCFPRRAWHFLVGMLLLSRLVAAQGTGGVIDGTVKDQDGGVVPGVQVTVNGAALIQKDVSVVTNADGYYRVPSLPPGTYTVDFVLQGFQNVQRAGIIVSTGQTTNISVQLKLATVTETVTVTGASPALDPTSATIGFNYTPQLLENVPTRRDFHEIMTTIPGVESASKTVLPGDQGYETVLGAGRYNNRYEMDGANVTDPAISSNQATSFSTDIIAEVQVLRGSKPAEVGYSTGGYFNIVTKSGGNKFSGQTSAYYQGDQFEGDNVDDRLRTSGFTQSNRLLNDPDVSLTAGGKVVQDRLWWFGSTKYEHKNFQLLGFAPTVEQSVGSYFWKNTVQAGAHNRFSALVNHWQDTTNYYFFGFSPTLAAGPEVSNYRPLSGNAAQGRWDGILGKTTVADFGFGWNRLNLPRVFQDNATVMIQDQVTGKRFGNPGTNQIINIDNFTARGSLSLFVSDLAGRHDFKFGGEYTFGPFNRSTADVEDHQLRISNGAPSQVIIKTPAQTEVDQEYTSFYAQDGWTIADRLTLNVGARYDRVSAGMPDQSGGGGRWASTSLANTFPQLKPVSYASRTFYTMNNIAPRVAASFNIDRSKRTVLKAGYARYYQNMRSQDSLNLLPNNPVSITFRWADPSRDGRYQIGEEGALLSLTGGSTQSGDPNLKHPYSDEYTVGASHELSNGFSISANFISRSDTDQIGDISLTVPFSSYTAVNRPDPLGGSITVFAQDPSTFGVQLTQQTNPSRLGFDNTREYKAFELIANKRFQKHWQFVGSFVGSRSLVVTTTSSSNSGNLFTNPNNLVNAKGLDDSNQTYQVKLQGTYFAPYGIVLSALHRYGSGYPYTRTLSITGLPQGTITVFAEPRGSRTTDSYNWIDMRVEKMFTLDGRRLELMLDVFNIANASTVLTVGTTTNVNLGSPQAVTLPRIARVGVRFGW